MRWGVLLAVIILVTLGVFVWASTVLAQASWPEPSGEPGRWSACTEALVESAPTPAPCLDR